MKRPSLIPVVFVLVLLTALFAGISAGALVFGRAGDDPGQLIFWIRDADDYGLFVVDSRRLLKVALSQPPSDVVVDIPRLSHDAQRAAFESARDGRLSVTVRDARRSTLYATEPGREDRLPALSPDGVRLARWTSTGQTNPRFQNWHLVVHDLSTGTVRPLTEELATIPYETPYWSPDGERLVVRFWRGGQDAGIYLVDVRDGAQTPLRPLVDAGGDLVWSPDATRLAFRTVRDHNAEIYVLDLTTQALANVTQHPSTDFQPAWSPDGAALAFASNRAGRGDVYVMTLAADGSAGAVRRLTEGGGWQPVWSPDGRFIAYKGRQGAHETLFVIRTDGHTPRQGVSVVDEQQVFVGWYAASADG